MYSSLFFLPTSALICSPMKQPIRIAHPTTQVFLQALQSDDSVWVDVVVNFLWREGELDLKEHKQAVLQKSLMVPLRSTAAMMSSSGCRFSLKGETIIKKHKAYRKHLRRAETLNTQQKSFLGQNNQKTVRYLLKIRKIKV